MDQQQAAAPKSAWQKYKRLVIGVGVLVALVLAMRQLSIPECSVIQAKIQEWGNLAPVVFFFIYVIATVAFIPGTIVTLMAGLAFGAVWGTVIVALAANTGAILAFLIARYVARDAVEGMLKKQAWFEKFKSSIEANGFSFMLFVRVVPLFPFNGLNYACGLVPLKLRDFVLGSVIGMLPGTFAYVYLGETGCKLIDPVIKGEGLTALPPDVRNSLFIAIGLLVGLSLLPLAMKKLRKQKEG